MAKYKELYNHIVNSIKDGTYKTKDKLPTEMELCNNFQISRQTVRRALIELSEHGYICRIKGSGSYVTWSHSEKKKTIGIMVAYMSSYVYPAIVRGIEQVLGAHNYGIDLAFSHYSLTTERAYLQRMLDLNVSGIIVEGVKSGLPNPNIDLYQKLINQGIPVIFINNHYNTLAATSLEMADEKLSYEMTKRIIKIGKKNILGCFKYDDIQGQNRYLGFVKALLDAGLPIENNNIFWFGDLDTKHENVFESYSSIMTINNICTRLADADGLIIYNDLLLDIIMQRAKQKKCIISPHLALASFDDDNFAHGNIDLPFISASHPKSIMGNIAAEEVLKEIANPSLIFKDKPNIITIPTEIQSRNTSI
ncbi:GntR family transcriptional regulator [Ohessyouella blattaphilus]|uniref:GntR family transcriptional regulator n=1 Tax=Ohessyouella blattaphilus TaxID=2949333 RepID=A0ABT1EJ83_9FIRM|nr:GntR family transcriptional regulator [Ohessyouella blattaphilus]MCP1110524.1 GntR family transcriptional regulator [Ohessyouella blattaphilus]MCR8563918.1 GntR family transcriptional regulator [Ohessyouella blattaphilus]MDL2249478.1 GntR family transcriptional regulator [Lachnospiraceae bacterium OttesenSCG-928-J05]